MRTRAPASLDVPAWLAGLSRSLLEKSELSWYSKGAYEPISVPNVCSEHLETASLYLLFLALVEVFGDFRRQIRIQHVELL